MQLGKDAYPLASVVEAAKGNKMVADAEVIRFHHSSNFTAVLGHIGFRASRSGEASEGTLTIQNSLIH